MSEKSKTLITETLLQLMERDHFHDITVSEICAWAKIARRTFYNNFASKEAVLRHCCYTVLQESIYLSEVDAGNHDIPYWKNFMTHYFSTNQKNSSFFSKLFEQNLFHMYVKLVHEQVYHLDCMNLFKNGIITREMSTKYTLPSYITVSLNMYEIWSSTGYEETADIYLKFILANTGIILGKPVIE